MELEERPSQARGLSAGAQLIGACRLAVNDQIKKAMHFRNAFIHPTVIFETGLLKDVGYYPTNFLHAEDYAFFYQLIKITHVHILGEYLVTCEINDTGISLKNRQEQLISRGRIVMKYGTNPLLKFAGILRVYALRFLPKKLVLQLRKLVK